MHVQGISLGYQDRSQQRPPHYTALLDKWGIIPYYRLSHSAERTTFSILLQNKIVIKYDFCNITIFMAIPKEANESNFRHSNQKILDQMAY